MKRADEVFGIATQVRTDSYVDRGGLDEKVSRYLKRDLHVALRGSSKSGKSWLRQKVLSDAIVIQCRFGHSINDLYRLALAELGLSLELKSATSTGLEGTISAEGEMGVKLIAKVRAKLGLTASKNETVESAPAVSAADNLQLISQLVLESGRRLVIEDFHYLSMEERKRFASDLKALWEHGLYVVIIGVWTQNNMLLNFNPDLSGRVREESIAWTPTELRKVLTEGGDALKVKFSDDQAVRLTNDSYGNVGILQSLALGLLDEVGIVEEQEMATAVDDVDAFEFAAMQYSEQLVPVFQTFANNVAAGIRRRKNSTAIYAHALAAVLQSSDETLLAGVSVDEIYDIAHAREDRIQKGNLKTALSNIESLQVDKDKRGIVLAYNPTNSQVSVVDRDLLFYRKYQTVMWPWEDLVRESTSSLG